MNRAEDGAAAPPADAQELPPAGTELPFVVLHHTGVPEPHFDLLLALPGDGRLPTWRLSTPPETWPTAAPAAVRIADHRRAYLTYEGPISGNRGHVRQIANGVARVRSRTPVHLVLYLNQLRCEVRLPAQQAPAG